MGAGIIITSSLDELIRAHCADYERRELLIIEKCMPRRVDMELRYLNYKIYEATSQIVGEDNAGIFIDEIGRRIGYANTLIDDMPERIYKELKKRVRDNIARGLYLVG